MTLNVFLFDEKNVQNLELDRPSAICPFKYKRQLEIRQSSSETSIFALMSMAIAQPGTVSNSTPPQDSRSAMWQWGSHCSRGETLNQNPLWARPHPHNPPTILPGLLEIFLGLQGTIQPKITGHISTFICIPGQAQTLQQQLFDHSQAQIEFWKVWSRYSWHAAFTLEWYEHRRSQTRIRVPH